MVGSMAEGVGSRATCLGTVMGPPGRPAGKQPYTPQRADSAAEEVGVTDRKEVGSGAGAGYPAGCRR